MGAAAGTDGRGQGRQLRTWQALLVDLGDDAPFWTALLRDFLDRQLTKAHVLAVMAAVADFSAHHRPVPGQMSPGRSVSVLACEHDRAFAAQAATMRAVYPLATFHTLPGAGHAAVFTHTGAYTSTIETFLSAAADDPQRAAPDRH